MKTLQKILALVIFQSLIFTLAGCAFSPRSAHEVPAPLRVLYLDSPNPYSPLSVQLQRTLQSVNIHFVNNIKDASVVLRITQNDFNYNIPTILDSGDASTYSYTIHVSYQLQRPSGKNITSPQTITVTRSLIQNANQVYTPNATALMKREVTRTAVILIYHDLMSLKTRLALKARYAT